MPGPCNWLLKSNFLGKWRCSTHHCGTTSCHDAFLQAVWSYSQAVIRILIAGWFYFFLQIPRGPDLSLNVLHVVNNFSFRDEEGFRPGGGNTSSHNAENRNLARKVHQARRTATYNRITVGVMMSCPYPWCLTKLHRHQWFSKKTKETSTTSLQLRRQSILLRHTHIVRLPH